MKLEDMNTTADALRWALRRLESAGVDCGEYYARADAILSEMAAQADPMTPKKAALPGAITPETVRAFRVFDLVLEAALADAKEAGVPQGLIVGLLHGHAHKQTSEMMENTCTR